MVTPFHAPSSWDSSDSVSIAWLIGSENSATGIKVDRLGGSCREFFHGPNNGEPKLQPHQCRNVASYGGSIASGLYGITELLPSGAATI